MGNPVPGAHGRQWHGARARNARARDEERRSEVRATSTAIGWGGLWLTGAVGVDRLISRRGSLAHPTVRDPQPAQPSGTPSPHNRQGPPARTTVRDPQPVQPAGTPSPHNRQGGNERGRPLDPPGQRKHRRSVATRSVLKNRPRHGRFLASSRTFGPARQRGPEGRAVGGFLGGLRGGCVVWERPGGFRGSFVHRGSSGEQSFALARR